MISTKPIIFLPFIKRRKKKRKRKKDKIGKKNTFPPYLKKGRKLSEVSANNVITEDNLY